MTELVSVLLSISVASLGAICFVVGWSFGRHEGLHSGRLEGGIRFQAGRLQGMRELDPLIEQYQGALMYWRGTAEGTLTKEQQDKIRKRFLG